MFFLIITKSVYRSSFGCGRWTRGLGTNNLHEPICFDVCYVFFLVSRYTRTHANTHTPGRWTRDCKKKMSWACFCNFFSNLVGGHGVEQKRHVRRKRCHLHVCLHTHTHTHTPTHTHPPTHPHTQLLVGIYTCTHTHDY